MPTSNKTIVDLYTKDHLKLCEIADLYNCSSGYIRKQLIKKGIDTSRTARTARINNTKIDYFNLDNLTQDSAYILGFTMADGYIMKYPHSLCFNLAPKDIEILEFIRDQISPGVKIHTAFTTAAHDTKAVRLQIVNSDLVKDLNKWNIFPNKTGQEKLPNIPNEFKSHYLRGYFDGDGHIQFKKRKLGDKYNKTVMSISCLNEQFLSDVKENLAFNCGQIRLVTDKRNNRKQMYTWYVSNASDLTRLYYYLYDNANFYLKRKYNIFKNLVEYHE